MKHMRLTNYLPLILIIAYLVNLVLIFPFVNTTNYMQNFMGLFFLSFAGLKLVNLRGFVMLFQEYDLVAHKSKIYAYLYPFLELFFGIALLISFNMRYVIPLIVVVTFCSLIGVLNAVFNKSQLKCACMGSQVNLPLTTVSLVENLLMFSMALALLIQIYS